ncbi:MAG: EF-P beta-lysylation protein EpmB [Hydrogenovibrio sp.]|nr:EF-P beta-lysylation protein EpmB [Hydrogenovibrio sp.]
MIQSTADLCRLVQLSAEQLSIDPESPFPLKVPKHFAEQIEKGNPQDPLLLQILPSMKEKVAAAGFAKDPVGDLQANPIPSLLHKYHGRALLITSPRCDIHCRYCFRRHFPYEQAKKAHWQEALDYLKKTPSIHEVILSGGDPFTLSENALIDLLEQLERLPHLETLRIHSRTPVVAPERADKSGWIEALAHSRFNVVLVVHCNHPNELSDSTHTLFRRYQAAGITLLNQSVLLKGVNDNTETLKQLSKKLFNQGVLPYYCHLLDRVEGASHFEVSSPLAWQIFDDLRKALPGYLVPRMVTEIAGEPYKTLIQTPGPNG